MKLYNIEKRCFDVLVSLTGLIISSPIFLFVALAVKISSPGPVFFKQERVGKNGKIFTILKFRTMKIFKGEFTVEQIRRFEASGKDPRTTIVGGILRGRWMDELPQLLNILKGDMSFVGPRPYFLPRIEENPKLKDRLKVKPGLTSLAVVKGGVTLSEDEILMYDLKYIEKQSFWLDISIFIKTVIIYASRLLYGKKI